MGEIASNDEEKKSAKQKKNEWGILFLPHFCKMWLSKILKEERSGIWNCNVFFSLNEMKTDYNTFLFNCLSLLNSDDTKQSIKIYTQKKRSEIFLCFPMNGNIGLIIKVVKILFFLGLFTILVLIPFLGCPKPNEKRDDLKVNKKN